ncbi:MAG: hypothetical protein ACYST6_09505 [Planctomycetota bacterium]
MAVPRDDELDVDRPKFYATPATRSASWAPILMCGNWKDCEPEPTDEPWDSVEEMERFGWNPVINEMRRVCHNRHGMFVNANFMDLSARKVGLKELWTTKWHKEWPRTCDHLPPEFDDPAFWLYPAPDPCPQ